MTPTSKLRFVERKIKLDPFYRDQLGGPAYRTVCVLQQWWEPSPGYYHPAGGEWRDVPMEAE